MQKQHGVFSAFSFSSESSDESCKNTPLVIWDSTQTYKLLSVATPLFNTPSKIMARDSLPFFPPRMAKTTVWNHHKGAKGETHWIPTYSDLQSSLAAAILLSKVKLRQQLPMDILWFCLSQQVGCVCSSERAESFEPPSVSSGREQGEQRLPLLTPVSSCNSSVNLEGDGWPYILPVACLKKLYFSVYFTLATGRESVNQQLLETESYVLTNSIQTNKSWYWNRRKTIKTTRRNGKQHNYAVMFTFFPQFPSHPSVFVLCWWIPNSRFSLPAASIPTQAPQSAPEEPTLLVLLSNSSREQNQAPVTAWRQLYHFHTYPVTDGICFQTGRCNLLSQNKQHILEAKEEVTESSFLSWAAIPADKRGITE